MVDLSVEAQEEIVLDCFSGRTSRYCGRCPAYYTTGGICCFGDIRKFDDDDNECTNCTFYEECRQEIIDRESSGGRRRDRPEVRRRLEIVPSKTMSPSSQYHAASSDKSVKPRDNLIQIGPNKSVPTKIGTSPDETLFQRFIKDFVWGAMQGAFEMGVHFFRNHRLP